MAFFLRRRQLGHPGVGSSWLQAKEQFAKAKERCGSLCLMHGVYLFIGHFSFGSFSISLWVLFELLAKEIEREKGLRFRLPSQVGRSF
jgi:hypothetical protein